MKALIIDNEVRDIEERDIDVFAYYHEDVAKLFIDCTGDVEIGDMYINGEFVKRETETEEESEV